MGSLDKGAELRAGNLGAIDPEVADVHWGERSLIRVTPISAGGEAPAADADHPG
jgi:hypothetical protein